MAPLAAIRAQSQAEQALPPDVDATILTANQQKNRQILDQAAVTFEQLRKFAEAKKLREASLALAEQVSGPQSAEYAMALVRLGDLARRYGTEAESNEFYQRALALGDRPEVFPALMRLALRSKDPETRRGYLERARIVGGNGNNAGTAMTWMAHDLQGEPESASQADALYRGAMALESPDSPTLAMTLELYAQFLSATGRTTEATPVLDRAKDIRKTLVRTVLSSRKMAADVVGVKVGGGVTAPKLLSKVEPEYSDEARSLAYQGTVMVKVVIDVDGLAKNLELVNGLGYGLDEKAAQAIALWKFQPGQKDGMPVPVQASIEVNFRLM
jgi:TonB family protein